MEIFIPLVFFLILWMTAYWIVFWLKRIFYMLTAILSHLTSPKGTIVREAKDVKVDYLS